MKPHKQFIAGHEIEVEHRIGMDPQSYQHGQPAFRPEPIPYAHPVQPVTSNLGQQAIIVGPPDQQNQ